MMIGDTSMMPQAPDRTTPKPTIDAWLVIDVSSYIDRDGLITAAGENYAWGIMSRAPKGAGVKLRLGALKALVSERLIDGLIDGGIYTARKIEIEGSDPEGVTEVLVRLRRIRPRYSPAAA